MNAPTPEGEASDQSGSDPVVANRDPSWNTQADPPVHAQADWSAQKDTYAIDRSAGDDPTLPLRWPPQ